MKKAAKPLEPLPVRAARMLARLKHVRGLNDAEKSVHALGLAATPQERWELFEASMRLWGFWKRSKRRKSWVTAADRRFQQDLWLQGILKAAQQRTHSTTLPRNM